MLMGKLLRKLTPKEANRKARRCFVASRGTDGGIAGCGACICCKGQLKPLNEPNLTVSY